MMKLFLPLCLALATAVSSATARDLHVLPAAAGDGSGASWKQALSSEAARALLRGESGGLQPGDKLLLGSGTYRGLELEITVSGTEGKPILIEGRDTGGGLPLLTGDWSEARPDKGPNAIAIAPGVHDVTLRGLRIEGAVVGVLATAAPDAAGVRRRLVFENIAMRRIRHGFYLSDCHDLRLQDCALARYTKHGFRLEDGCRDAALIRCTADCSEGDAAWEKLTEELPFGFFANGSRRPNQNLRFEDCEARNNLMPLQKKKYKNGDGFVLEEGNTAVRLLRCRSFRNQDGGYDLKSPGVHLEDCVATGNSRNYRLWNAATLVNCLSAHASDGLWSHTGPVTATRCTFHALDNATAVDDDARATITLRDSLLSEVKRPLNEDSGGKLVLDESNPATGVRLKNPAPDWNGQSDAFDSTSHPGKGWRYPVGSGAPPKG